MRTAMNDGREIRHNWLWLDLETTGLDPREGRILEYAALLVDDGPGGDMSVTVYDTQVLQFNGEVPLNDVVQRMHTDNGLLSECARSAISCEGAESRILSLLGIDKGVPLAGASVHFDLAWVRAHMPRLASRLHYRVLDVSTLKAAAAMWGGYESPKGPRPHRALDDIRASLEEARRIRDYCFEGAL